MVHSTSPSLGGDLSCDKVLQSVRNTARTPVQTSVDTLTKTFPPRTEVDHKTTLLKL